MTTLDPNRTVNVAVQVLPLVEDVYPVVDRAIAVIAQSGVRYEVGPMETVMEGPLDRLLEVAKAAHLACFEAGAARVMTIIKIGDQTCGTTIDEKVTKYRS
ncbi:MAG: MTH1187 family thiamine-binding protein [Anaerolineales bacterium]|nr:MTH1187 family thiamine-binding protein [Anaerolineales bacterium]